jgi:AraC-like DNA-binding protein
MKRATSPDELACNPIDRYWLGSSHLVWCRDATLCGAIWWGSPSTRDLDELARAFELVRHPALAGGFDMLVDGRALERLDWAVIAQLLAYVRGCLPDWRVRIRRQAIAIRPGPATAMIENTAALLGVPYGLRFVDDTSAAVDWLGWSSRLDARRAVDEAAALAREGLRQKKNTSAIVQRLQHWLESALDHASVEAAATALGLSSRTLQRDLRDAGTSFTTEVWRARMRVACQLLVETDHKVEVIAREVGCSSASQLSALFKRCVGDTPARYRERRR